MSSPPPLSIIIPAHNAADTLPLCLDAVFTFTIPVQVIVVDDGSTDATALVAAQAQSGASSKSNTEVQFQLVSLEKNRGAAAARNVGASVATSPLLFFLDADILTQPDTAARILDEFERDPTLTALFGSYQKDTVPQNFVSVYKNLLHHYTHQHSSEQAVTFCGGYGAIRRSVFCDIGGFNESYAALEDIELGYRLAQGGYKVRLVKDLQFTHLKTYTLASLVRSDMQNRAIPWTELMLDKRIFQNDLNTKSNNIASVVVSFVLLTSILWVWFVPFGLALVAALVVLFVILNFDFFRFVTQERGWVFGAETVLMSWFNYIYSGVGLLLGVGAFVVHRLSHARA